MFIEVRNVALQLLPVWRVAFLDTRVWAPMANWLPPGWTRLYWQSQEQCDDVLTRWGNVVRRNEELELWRELVAVVTCRARCMICGARVPGSAGGGTVERQERSKLRNCGGLWAVLWK